MKFLIILFCAVGVIALPFLFQRTEKSGPHVEDALELVVITPHNEAIRHEFGQGFSAWHLKKFGKPVRLDWRVIGGTTEIMRYLSAEYRASAKRFVEACARKGVSMTSADAMKLDDPKAVTCRMDLFFGGGTYDHGKAETAGLTVPAWRGEPPVGLFTDERGRTLIPKKMNGEVWCGKAYYGNVLSTFGICYNTDRLEDLGWKDAPSRWEDLADPKLCGWVGLADPTKSGSVAKAFEMMIHAACARSVASAGFSSEQIERFEAAIAKGGLKAAPEAYHEALAAGWQDGLRLVRRIGANARYFTDSAGKVPVDVGKGATAAGICIDFFGRLQSAFSKQDAQGNSVLRYVTPDRGSSVSADPVSLLRGAPHRELAVRMIEYILSEEGQCLWNVRKGEPGGPDRFSLRRLPIRRTFYPSDDPEIDRRARAYRGSLSDPLWEEGCDAYALASKFVYHPRWTGRHFGVQRDVIRAMCMDSGEELRAAWKTILANGGPERQPEAMRLLESFPQEPFPLDWEHALSGYAKMGRMERLRVLTAFFRKQYREARRAVVVKE